MQMYLSKDLEVEQMKEDAAREWEERKHEASPDLALLVKADLHSGVSEQTSGKRRTLRLTQVSPARSNRGFPPLCRRSPNPCAWGKNFHLSTFPSTLWISHSWFVPGYVLVGYL